MERGIPLVSYRPWGHSQTRLSTTQIIFRLSVHLGISALQTTPNLVT